ncbi:MAG: 50S ribosomal protein L21 [Oscillospiraceae bacterium]|jgi:large subunit ribosomal protein L21|nr:50S ribosomal protein L21 [Oscillospiraceae bacterium]
MYAIIETGGKQYKVENGDVIYAELLKAEAEQEVSFDVIAIGGDDGLTVGDPYVKGAVVTGKVVKNGKGKKINILTYKPKKGYMKRKGHRQPYTKIEITAINA